MSAPQIDWPGHEDTLRFAELLLAGNDGVVELRAIGVRGVFGNGVVSGYFDNPAKLAGAAQSLDGRSKGIYATLNPVQSALLARANNRLEERPKSTTSDDEIVQRRRLLIDVDPQRPAGISASDEEREEAFALLRGIVQFLKDRGFPPAIKGDSGNGGHLILLIDLPVGDDGLVERFLRALAFRFDTETVRVDQTVSNPARITKLFGTLAMKGDSTADRPHRRSKLIDVPDELVVVSRELLASVADELPREEPKHTATGPSDQRPIDVDELLARHQIEVARRAPWKNGQKWVLETCPFDSDHADQAAFVLQFPSGALSAGCLHNGCAGKSWRDLRDLLEPGRRDRPQRRKPVSAGLPSPRPSASLPYRQFPAQVLPELLNRYVVSASKALGCDPAYVALPMLAACAGAIGNTRRIRLKQSWCEPSVLWTSVVAQSGTLKSPAQDKALAPIDDIQDLAFRRFEREQAEYEARLAAIQEDKKRGAKNAGGDPDGRPVPPVLWRLTCSDVTIEAVAPLMRDAWRGMVLKRDELAGWFAGFNQYKGGRGADRSQWLEIHGARPMTVDRKTGSEPVIRVPRAALSITGGIQPGVLKRSIGGEDMDSGLAARILFAYPPRIAKRWTEHDVSLALEAEYRQLFEQLYRTQPRRDSDNRPQPVDLPLSPDAKSLWVKFYNEHAEQQSMLSGGLAAAWSKLEGYAARLGLIVHTIRGVTGGTHDPMAIDADSIKAGIALSDWFAWEARRIYALLDCSEEQLALNELLDHVRAQDSDVKVRDWQRGRSHARVADAEDELASLEAAGLGEFYWRPGKNGTGRDSRWFRLTEERPSDKTPSPDSPGGVVSVSGNGDPPDASSVDEDPRPDQEPEQGAAGGIGPSDLPGVETSRRELPLKDAGPRCKASEDSEIPDTDETPLAEPVDGVSSEQTPVTGGESSRITPLGSPPPRAAGRDPAVDPPDGLQGGSHQDSDTDRTPSPGTPSGVLSGSGRQDDSGSPEAEQRGGRKWTA